jgi:CRISPR system Cascade subunit CasA
MSEQFTFNLVDERWIPCIRADDGRSVTLTLRETLAENHTLYDIAGDTPLQTAALYRLLIAILLRVYRPAANDFQIWPEMWRSPTWDMQRINAYLDEWRHRFDLFDRERPFYQSDSDDSRVRPKPITSVKYGNGFLHNPLFDHDNEENGQAITAAEAARNLIAVQTFGLGGGHKGMFSDAPWSKGFLLFIQGDNLKETIFLNLLPYPDENRAEIGIDDTKDDAPAWEQDDPFVAKGGQPFGYLDYLTWQNRRILFFPEWRAGRLMVSQWQVGGGLSLTAEIADPAKFYSTHEKEGLRVYQFNESRSFWPNSYALFAPMTEIGRRSGRYSVPPTAFAHLRFLVDEMELLKRHTIYRCKAMGQGKSRAKVEFLREEHFPFPLTYLISEDLRNRLRDALQETKDISQFLYKALCRVGMYLFQESPDNHKWEDLRINTQNDGIHRDEISKSVKEEIVGRWDKGQLKKPGWIIHTDADIYFWSVLDVPFQRFIARLATEDAETTTKWWRRQIRAAAEAAFAKAKQYAHESDRAFRAVIEGQNYLSYQLNETLDKEVNA